MDKFFNLPLEKQNAIINAAQASFGANGYKKASISDIAAAAGISKAMVFHYFGTKKELYFYLINYSKDIVVKEVNDKFDSSITDFFERIKMSADIEFAVLRKHPALSSFIISVYFEANEEVAGDIKALFDQSDEIRNKIVYEGMDTSKFKEGIDIKLVMNILLWMADGFMNTSKGEPMENLDSLLDKFYECMELLRRNFYKPEFTEE